MNHPLGNFTIMLEGYSTMYDTPPDIKLEDDSGSIVWTNYDDIDHVKSSHVLPIEFCKEYKFNDIGGPLTINKTGTYKMIFSFGDIFLEKELLVLESMSHVGLDKPDLHCTPINQDAELVTETSTQEQLDLEKAKRDILVEKNLERFEEII